MRIRNGFEEFFCLRSNLNNDKIISAHRPGLKTGVENYIFWSERGSGFGEPGGTSPPRIPRSTSRGVPSRRELHIAKRLVITRFRPSGDLRRLNLRRSCD